MFNIGDVLTSENYTQGAIWCNANNAMIEEINNEYVIVAVPKKIMTREEVDALRKKLYTYEVDPMMSEYNRKKTFNLFEEGEEAELLRKIEAKVSEIKTNNPYPEV